jgi:hypothetical protein
MKVHGWCESCKKIKLVRTTNAGMVRLALNKPVFGICSSCEELERQAARDRHPAFRNRNQGA